MKNIGRWIRALFSGAQKITTIVRNPSFAVSVRLPTMGSNRVTVMDELAEFKIKPRGFKPAWIVIHHSFSPDSREIRNWDSQRTYHMSYRHRGNIITAEQYNDYVARGDVIGLEKPWNDIGYHFGIELVAGRMTIHEGRAIGSAGAHALGFNTNSVALCLIGNYDTEVPSDARMAAAAGLCRKIQRGFGIMRENIIGHRETFIRRGVVIEKSCPGLLFDMDKLRAMCA